MYIQELLHEVSTNIERDDDFSYRGVANYQFSFEEDLIAANSSLREGNKSYLSKYKVDIGIYLQLLYIKVSRS